MSNQTPPNIRRTSMRPLNLEERTEMAIFRQGKIGGVIIVIGIILVTVWATILRDFLPQIWQEVGYFLCILSIGFGLGLVCGCLFLDKAFQAIRVRTLTGDTNE